MLRSVALAAVVVVVSSSPSVFADDVKKPNGLNKSEFTKVENEKGKTQKEIQKDSEQKFDKTKAGETKPPDKRITKAGDVKKAHAVKQPAAVVASETDYYTTSPAQGRPADGQLKAGTKVRVVERTGSYVRVVAEIEAYVSADSFKELENQLVEKNKVAFDKGAALKKTSAAGDKTAEKKAADKKQVGEKKGGIIDKAALKKSGAAESKAAADKKATAIKGVEKNDVKK